VCEFCNNEYKFHSWLWKHKKTCTYKEHNDITEDIPEEEPINDDNSDTDVKLLSNTIFELVKQNNEFKQLLVEQNQKMMEMVDAEKKKQNCLKIKWWRMFSEK